MHSVLLIVETDEERPINPGSKYDTTVNVISEAVRPTKQGTKLAPGVWLFDLQNGELKALSEALHCVGDAPERKVRLLFFSDPPDWVYSSPQSPAPASSQKKP